MNMRKDNLDVTSSKLKKNIEQTSFLISNIISDKSAATSLDNFAVFPLYLNYNSADSRIKNSKGSRTPNLNPEIVNQIASNLSLTFINEKVEPAEGEVCFANSEEVRPEFRQTFAQIDILDYIYALLNSPAYREKYKEFLKLDFPRVPYPTDTTTFWQLVKLGGKLRQLHLLKNPVIEKYITQFPVDGDNMVGEIRFEYIAEIIEENAIINLVPSMDEMKGKVYINDTQYFDNVPEIPWNFYIGGYQPAQKWLKDRKGSVLNFEDIRHYQKIIVALMETGRIMKEMEVPL